MSTRPSSIPAAALLAFAAVWHLAPGEPTKGYEIGNEDGHRTHYNLGPEWN